MCSSSVKVNTIQVIYDTDISATTIFSLLNITITITTTRTTITRTTTTISTITNITPTTNTTNTTTTKHAVYNILFNICMTLIVINVISSEFIF